MAKGTGNTRVKNSPANRLTPAAEPQRQYDDHAPKEQQQQDQSDNSSGGKGDAGLGKSTDAHKPRPDRDHTPTL